MECPKCGKTMKQVTARSWECECGHGVLKTGYSYRLGPGWKSISELTSRPDIADKLNTIARDAVLSPQDAMRRYFSGDIPLDDVWRDAIDDLDMTALDEGGK